MRALAVKAAVCAWCVGLIFPCSGVQSQLTYKEYEDQLTSSQQREKAAKEEIATEQGKIESVKQQLFEVSQQTAAAVNETYALAGTNEQGVTAAETEAASIQQDLEALLALTPEDLAKRQGDIKALEDRLSALKAKPLSNLSRLADRCVALSQLVDQVKSRVRMASAAPAAAAPAPDKTNSYTVKLVRENRECLYRISGYDFVFGDPAKWPYLYRGNQSIIDKGYQRYKSQRGDGAKYSRAADLIFPGQVLDIPR
jgi:hypothetical protein